MAASRSSWGFVGGYFLYFLGLAAGFVGTIVAQGEHGRPYGDDTPLVVAGLVGTGVALFALGVQVLARAYWGGFSGSSETLVIFIMTPIPAVVAVVIHLLGRYFRRSDGTALRVLLLAGGVYLAATTGMDVANHGIPTGKDDPMAFLWPLALSAGVGLALLGLVPPAREEADVPYAAVA
ncbi:hypothetical protein J0H58_38585 [bacterium]|nr:hypothetical protein [bacterium]